MAPPTDHLSGFNSGEAPATLLTILWGRTLAEAWNAQRALPLA